MGQIILLSTIVIFLGIDKLLFIFGDSISFLLIGLSILLLIIASVFDIYDVLAQDILSIVTVVPTILLMMVALQVPSPTYFITVFYGLLLFVSLLFITHVPTTHQSFRFKNSVYILVGIVLGGVCGLLCSYTFSLPPFLLTNSVITYGLLVGIPVTHTLYFHALVQHGAEKMTDRAIGLIFTGIIAALLFTATSLPIAEMLFGITVIGGLVYALSRSIYPVFIYYVSGILMIYLVATHIILLPQ